MSEARHQGRAPAGSTGTVSCSLSTGAANVTQTMTFVVKATTATSRSPLYETDPNILAGLKELQMPVLPVFELVCTQGPLAGNTYYTSDPGKALITGQCSDIGRGKGLILRGLAARAPYFHDGVAGSLPQVVNFYNQRFQIGLTTQQMQDLVNFLQTL